MTEVPAEETPTIDCVTAFTVVLGLDGNVSVDLSTAHVPAHQSTVAEIQALSRFVYDSVSSAPPKHAVPNQQEMIAQALAERYRNDVE